MYKIYTYVYIGDTKYSLEERLGKTWIKMFLSVGEETIVKKRITNISMHCNNFIVTLPPFNSCKKLRKIL